MVNANAITQTFRLVSDQDMDLPDYLPDRSHIQSLSQNQALADEMSPLLEPSIDPPKGRLIILRLVRLSPVLSPTSSRRLLRSCRTSFQYMSLVRSNHFIASWTVARKDKDGRQLPQTIAHRGDKASFPENTMAAFRSAVEIGSHAIETDIHLSKDNVVVLSHVCSTVMSLPVA